MYMIPAGLSDEALEDVVLAGARAIPNSGALTCSEAMSRYIGAPERRAAALSGLLACAAELAKRSALKALVGQPVIHSPQLLKEYLRKHFAGYEHEAFVVVFLNAQHRVIAVEEIFRGTLTQTSVYPREVVKRSLAQNAGAVVLAHNHPSGEPEPSRADEHLTQTLKSALALVDVRVIDHAIVAGDRSVSMAERGLM
jgi:DNA repair protein RadC